MPSRKRFIELYRADPVCAITGHVFDPVNDPEQLLPTPALRDRSTGHSENNLVFVTRFVGNSMRNGYSTLAQVAEAFDLLPERKCAPRTRAARPELSEGLSLRTN